MQCTICSVTHHANGWVAECGPLKHGPYASRDMAVRVAVTDACELRSKGCGAKVSVQGCDGAIRAEYCLCAALQRMLAR